MEHLGKRLISWASEFEPTTREQAEATSRLPFVFPHVALMPDAHLGKGATVGSVIPTLRAIVPAAVGVDIGCGMIAVHPAVLPGRRRARSERAAQGHRAGGAPVGGGANRAVTGTAVRRVGELENLAAADGVDPDR